MTIHIQFGISGERTENGKGNNMAHVIMYTEEDCPMCDIVKDAFKLGGDTIEELPASEMPNNPHAMEVADAQGYALPVVNVDGKWKNTKEVLCGC